MGVIVRQSIKATIVNYIGTAIGFITTFFVVTRFLTSEEIGLTKVFIDSAALLAGLAQLGTNASVLRFYPYFKDSEKKDHGFFFWSLVVPLVGFFIYVIVFLILKVPVSSFFIDKSPLIIEYYYYIIPLAFFILYLSVFETNAIVLLRITVPKFVKEVGIRIMLLFAYLLYAIHLFNIKGLLISICVVYAAATVLNVFYLFSLKRISLKPDFKHLTKSLKKDYLLYTLFLITASIGRAIIPGINTFFISAKMGLMYTGIFTIATYISSLIEIPYRSLNAISQPHISQSVKNGDIAETNKISRNVALHQSLAGSFIFFLIWINIDLIFKLIPNGEQFSAGKSVVFLLGILAVFNTSVNVGITVLSYSRFYYYSLLFTFLMTASAITFNNLLIPIWGMNGAVFASLFSSVIYYSLLLSLVWGKMKVLPFSLGQLKIAVIIFALFAFNWFSTILLTPIVAKLPLPIIYIDIFDGILRSSILIIGGVIAVYYWKVSVEVNGLVQKYCKKLIVHFPTKKP
jgi:O-antigen/teichoic acid export membrane protein